jgi:hypothetical protein
MCLSPCATRLAVPAGNGILYSLCTTDGSTVSQLDCGTEVRALPVTDPWQGLWWVVTHGRELLVVEPQSLTVAARFAGVGVGVVVVVVEGDVTDPWQGLWWVVTHGRELLVVEPQSLTVAARWVVKVKMLATIMNSISNGC